MSADDDCLSRLQSLLLNSSVNFSPYFDATGKLGPSLVEGNRVWLGDYEACQALNQSLYCVADLSVNLSPPLQANLSSAVLRWGLCAVEQCSESVLTSHASSLIRGVTSLPWIEVVNATVTCTKETALSTGFYATLSLLLVLVVLGLLGTTFDLSYRYSARMRWKLIYRISRSGPHVVAPPDEWGEGIPNGVNGVEVDEGGSTATLSSDDVAGCQADRGRPVGNGASLDGAPSGALLQRAYSFQPDLKAKLGQCFSFYTSIRSLSDRRPDDIVCLHALRVLSLALIILGQTYFAAYSSVLTSNPGVFSEVVKRFSWQLIGSYYYAIDTFLLISGLLLSYHGLKRLQRNNGRFQLVPYFLLRFIRLAPSVGILLLVWMHLLPFIASGPVWQKTEATESERCRQFWWTNLLFIQNFYPTSTANACVGWVWYLAVDWQLFCLSAILLFALHRGRALLLFVFVVASLVVTVTLISVYRVSISPAAALLRQSDEPGVFWGYVNIVLTKPYCRAVPYLVGLWLGQRLHLQRGVMVRLRRHYVVIGWVCCVLLSVLCVYSLYPAMLGYDYGASGSAICGALVPLAWSLANVWCIYACRHLCAGPLDFLFSWSGWLPLSRLSFGAFLFHGVFLRIFFHGLHQSFHLSDVTIVAFFLMTLTFSFLSSVLLSLLVESPIARLLSMCRG